MVCVDWGYLPASVPGQPGQAEDRGVIVPLKPVKAGGGKGARESEWEKLYDLKIPRRKCPSWLCRRKKSIPRDLRKGTSQATSLMKSLW